MNVMTAAPLNDVFLHQTLSSLVGGTSGWLFKLSTPDKQGDTDHSSLWWLSRTLKLVRMTAEDASNFGPQWSSDGEHLGFLRAVDGITQAFSLPLCGGEARRITDVEYGIASIEHWDAAAHRLLVLAYDGAKPTSVPCVIEHLPYKLDGSGINAGRATYLYEVCEYSGKVTALVDSGGNVAEAKWAPDCSAIAYTQKRDGAQRHVMDLWLRQSCGATRQLTHELVSISALTWSPDGTRLAFAGSRTEGSSMSWLCVLDIADGRLREWPIELAIPGTMHWAPGGRELCVMEAYRGMHRIAKVALDGDEPPVALVELEHTQVLAMAAVDERLVYIAAGPQSGPELWACHSDGSGAEQVTRFNQWRRQRPRMRVERRYFEVPDGDGGSETIDGWLFVPQGTGPFPLLLDMHGGPHSLVTFEHEMHAHWPVLVAHGWAVLALNAVGTNSYGERFAKRLCGRWGELDLPQWLAAVDTLRNDGIADERLAVFGHSYGGFLSAWALTQKVPLIAGVVSAGIINMESHTGTSDSGYYVGPYSMGAEAWQARDRYRALSPASHAEHIQVPTLLLQGDRDERCPIGQAEELFAQLVRRGETRVRMVVFPGGTHHVSTTGKPSYRLAYHQHLVDWLEDAREQVSGRRKPAETAKSRNAKPATAKPEVAKLEAVHSSGAR
jgi:dipeptidyl aminopeptidase/acylaminoacyl peptidase